MRKFITILLNSNDIYLIYVEHQIFFSIHLLDFTLDLINIEWTKVKINLMNVQEIK